MGLSGVMVGWVGAEALLFQEQNQILRFAKDDKIKTNKGKNDSKGKNNSKGNRRSFDCASRGETARGYAQDDNVLFFSLEDSKSNCKCTSNGKSKGNGRAKATAKQRQRQNKGNGKTKATARTKADPPALPKDDRILGGCFESSPFRQCRRF
jgi:hypothetical protein